LRSAEDKPMQRLAIVADSPTDIPPTLAEELDILVAPVWAINNGKEYRNKVDINSREFCRLSPRLKALPTTTGVLVEDS